MKPELQLPIDYGLTPPTDEQVRAVTALVRDRYPDEADVFLDALGLVPEVAG